MREKNHEPAFIPCGDSFEKMNELNDKQMETVSGGSGCSGQQDDVQDDNVILITNVVITDHIRQPRKF